MCGIVVIYSVVIYNIHCKYEISVAAGAKEMCIRDRRKETKLFLIKEIIHPAVTFILV